MKEFDRNIQAFDSVGDKAKKESEPLFHNLLIEWAQKQPQSPLGFIDIASGIGVEARLLCEAGYQCIAQDPSEPMIQQNQNAFALVGSAEKLAFPDRSFSGILLKDAWLFLSPTQRLECLIEVKRTLVPSGSLLIKSERADIHRAKYLPNNSKLAQSLPSSDFATYNEWVQAVIKLQEVDDVYTIEYRSMPDDIMELAEEVGLSVVHHFDYDSKHPLATDNRWVQKSGFLLELKN